MRFYEIKNPVYIVVFSVLHLCGRQLYLTFFTRWFFKFLGLQVTL